MLIKELFDTLNIMDVSHGTSYNVILYNGCYYGVNNDKNIVFLTKSLNPSPRSWAQQTNLLYLGLNISCLINDNKSVKKDIFDILICFDKDPKNILTFLQLTNVFIESSKAESSIKINTFFDSLKRLFENKKQLPISDLQGLYGELYFINYMNLLGIDIGLFWQSQDKMKFDFSIDANKKIEVKTTISETRKHKFKHEQLVSDIYDTWIVSCLLRKDDRGMSLFELSEIVKKNNPLNIQLNTHIAELLNNYTEEELQSIKFNNSYTENNLRFYNTSHVPKFPGKQPYGVTNTEYDADLTSVQSSPIVEIVNWLKV